MDLSYDPGEGQSFWDPVSRLPGYPTGVHRPIQTMIFRSGALHDLPRVLLEIGAGPEQPVLMVVDRTPMLRSGEDLKSQVMTVLSAAGRHVEPVILAPDASGQVHADEDRVEEVKTRLRQGVCVVSVGSGTVTDIAKHACYQFEQESRIRLAMAVYQTANSVSAFTSNMAVISTRGVKRTRESRYADALICDLETLRDAPREMTVAGVGDLLAAFVSLPDWCLAHRLGLDPSYSGLPQALMGRLEQVLLTQAPAIRAGSVGGMAVLAKLIALAGLTMSLSHATTPLSGLEHVMSHVLDMVATQAHLPLAQHGTQVALAAIIGAEVYRRFLDGFRPEAVQVAQCCPAPDQMRRKIEEVFAPIDPTGGVAAECWADYQIKLAAWHAQSVNLAAFLRDWPVVRAEIEPLTRPPEALAAILRGVDAPLCFGDLDPPLSEAQIKFAFLGAPLMRKRLTIGDLLIFFGWDREQLWREVWRKVGDGGISVPG